MLPRWLGVSFSALLFSLAFIFPPYCAPFVFLFLVPLIYSNLTEGLRWKDGFLWGFLFFSIALFPLTMVMYERGHGEYRMVASLALVFASALYSALWFLLVNLINRLLPACKEYTFIVISLFYFLFVEQYLFWFLRPTIGYVLISPLIPLAYNARWLQGISLFDWRSTLFLILLINLGIFQMLVKRGKLYALCTFALMMPFLWGWIEQNPIKIPERLTKIGYMQPVGYGRAADMAADIATRLERGVRMEQYILVIMPESSFPYPLNEYDEAVSCWGHAQQKIPFIIGSHRKDMLLHNTLYCVNDGRIIYYYDKKLLVPFTENVPEGKFFDLFKGLFLTASAQFYPGFKKKCECLVLEGGHVFQPLICSELFLGSLTQCAQHPKAPYICIANESWFSIAWQKELLVSAAKLQALRTGAEILYVGHTLGLWITSEGIAYPLRSL